MYSCGEARGTFASRRSVAAVARVRVRRRWDGATPTASQETVLVGRVFLALLISSVSRAGRAWGARDRWVARVGGSGGGLSGEA